jgi:hypothetical protein
MDLRLLKKELKMVNENDVVLIYLEDEPLIFARVEQFTPDIKADWFHVKLLLLQLPLQPVSWILRDAYINGDEFTMNGKRMRIEPVVCPEIPGEKAEENNSHQTDKKTTGAKVISLADLKKKGH